MFELTAQHEFWTAVASYWIFSAAVSAMPAPRSNGNQGYLWLYRFLHTLAGNITSVFGSRMPGSRTLLVLAIPLLLSASACVPRYTIHPGALNRTDSVAYDALLAAQAAIDRARMEFNSGQLPNGSKEPLNALIAAYNVARASWLTYRGALANGLSPGAYVEQLTAHISELSKAIRAFKEAQ